MATLRIEYGRRRADKKMRVYIILSHRGNRKRIDSGIDIEAADLQRDRRIKTPTIRRAVEKRLEQCRDAIYQTERDNIGREIDVDTLYNACMGIKPGTLDFFDFADEYLATSEIKGKKNYTTMLNSLSRFLGRRSIPFRDITYRLLSDYMLSLRDKPRAQSLYLGAIRHLHRQARLQYNTESSTVITGDVFDRFRVPRQKQKGQRAVDAATIRRIYAYQGTGRAQLARDCFLLSFLLMGMNSADMYDTDAVIRDGKLCYHRKKTRDRRTDGAYIEIIIPQEAQPIIDRYKGKGAAFSFRDRYSNEQEFNRALNIGLKKMSEDLGIEKLQFYAARHTWASIAYNDCRIDKGVVNDALIHIDKTTAVTDLYIKKDYARVNEANRTVIDFTLRK